jgi:hypothetical protein
MPEAASQGDLRDRRRWGCTQKFVTRAIEPDSAQKFNWRLMKMVPEPFFQCATRDVTRGRQDRYGPDARRVSPQKVDCPLEILWKQSTQHSRLPPTGKVP